MELPSSHELTKCEVCEVCDLTACPRAVPCSVVVGALLLLLAVGTLLDLGSEDEEGGGKEKDQACLGEKNK